ncbi:DVU_1553 family AMP-dependent CoA ligase [Megalodesulfovibrio paquesii]
MRAHRLDAWIARGLGESGRPDPAILDTRRLELLNATLAWARACSPFWRAHLAGTPEALDSLEQLAGLPMLTAQELRIHGAALCCLPQGAFERVVTIQTSATTGPPKRLYFTGEDLAATVDFFAAGMSHIVPPGEAVLLLMPGGRPGTVGDLLGQGLERIGSPCHAAGFLKDVGMLHAAVQAHSIRCVVGLPWQLLAAARAGGPIPGVRSVLLSADRAPQWLVDELRQRLDCEVFLHWGMTETCLGGAVDCPDHDGLHPRLLDLHLEIIDPHTNQPLAPGEWGEVVLTTLARRGMPLIRYRTGDFSRLLVEPCACGSRLPRLENPAGRLQPPLVLPSGGTLEEHALDDAVLQTPGLSACLLEWRQAGGRAGERDCLHVLASGSGHDLEEAIAAQLRSLRGGEPPGMELAVECISLETLLAQAPPKRLLRRISMEESAHASV